MEIKMETTKIQKKFCATSLLPIRKEEASVVILGLPYEGIVNSRLGAIQGPDVIRTASDVIESYSPFLDKELESVKIFDDGDVPVYGKGKEALDGMAEAIKERLPKHARPLFLGGDHSVSYSCVKALSEMGLSFSLLQLDAHPDCQDSYENDPWSYACWLRRAKEAGFIRGEIYQLGIRTSTREELMYASRTNKLFLMNRFVEGIRKIAEETKGKNLYVSFDIDVLDPSLAPGTSNPTYGGMLYDHIQAFLHALRDTNVIGMDITEVAPNLDESGRTAIIASEIVRDAILTWWC
jgi:agmatinase